MAQVKNAILDTLNQAHVELLKELRGLEEIVKAPAGGEPCDTTYHLVRARERLTEHFRFEEQGGYMHAVLEREPKLAPVAKDLEAEHRSILQTLDALITDARSGHACEPDFCARVRRCVVAVRRHEAQENQLLQDAFNLDIHACD